MKQDRGVDGCYHEIVADVASAQLARALAT
jgi:hypothetical protein